MTGRAMMFGDQVVVHREALGMSQKVLAERIGLTPSHLNRIEKGTRPPPNVTKVLRMVEALRLTRAEANELVQLAGYSPLVLEGDGSLAYSSPSADASTEGLVADLHALHEALAKLPPHHQQKIVDAIVVLVRNVGGPGEQPATPEDSDEDE